MLDDSKKSFATPSRLKDTLTQSKARNYPNTNHLTHACNIDFLRLNLLSSVIIHRLVGI